MPSYSHGKRMYKPFIRECKFPVRIGKELERYYVPDITLQIVYVTVSYFDAVFELFYSRPK